MMMRMTKIIKIMMKMKMKVRMRMKTLYRHLQTEAYTLSSIHRIRVWLNWLYIEREGKWSLSLDTNFCFPQKEIKRLQSLMKEDA